MPAPSRCAQGWFYEPREEVLVKVWDLRRSLAAKPAVLCKGCKCSEPGLALHQCFRSTGAQLCPADKGAGGRNPAGKGALNGFCKEAQASERVVIGGCELMGLLSPVTTLLCQETRGWLFVSARKGHPVSTVFRALKQG